MIALRKVADLELSAASGIVRVGPTVYVVADDEHFIDAYRVTDGHRCGRVPLGLGGELPGEQVQRKRIKPDLECLALLPGDRMIALGSGSSPNRQVAIVLELRAGDPHSPRPVNLSPLYDELRRSFDQLNIEGAAVAGGVFRLLQRGNGRSAQNAVVDLDLDSTLVALKRGRLTTNVVRAVRPVELGELHGVPLGFTDASPVEPGCAHTAFVATAEDTDDPYEDGPCAGSVMGVLDERGRMAWMEPVEGHYKLEGITVGDAGSVLMVADSDDRARLAPLLEAVGEEWTTRLPR